MTRFWPKNSPKNVHIYFASFRPFLAKKRGKFHPISILRPDLESTHQGASLRPHNERRVTTLFFDPHCNFETLVARGRVGMKILEKFEPWPHLPLGGPGYRSFPLCVYKGKLSNFAQDDYLPKGTKLSAGLKGETFYFQHHNTAQIIV